MHNLFELAPRQFNPWAYAKSASKQSYRLLIQDCTELKETDDLEALIGGHIDEYQQNHLFGEVRTQLKTICQRCLEPIVMPIEHHFDYVLLRSEAQESLVQGEEESLICPDDTLDLAWLLEEEMLLALPMIVKHEQCQLPQTIESSEKRLDTHQPFADLKKLLKQE